MFVNLAMAQQQPLQDDKAVIMANDDQHDKLVALTAWCRSFPEFDKVWLLATTTNEQNNDDDDDSWIRFNVPAVATTLLEVVHQVCGIITQSENATNHNNVWQDLEQCILAHPALVEASSSLPTLLDQNNHVASSITPTRTSLLLLLQHLLRIAVSHDCVHRRLYIERILKLPSSIQRCLKEMIEANVTTTTTKTTTPNVVKTTTTAAAAATTSNPSYSGIKAATYQSLPGVVITSNGAAINNNNNNTTTEEETTQAYENTLQEQHQHTTPRITNANTPMRPTYTSSSANVLEESMRVLLTWLQTFPELASVTPLDMNMLYDVKVAK